MSTVAKADFIIVGLQAPLTSRFSWCGERWKNSGENF
jgi:hypothetical protein